MHQIASLRIFISKYFREGHAPGSRYGARGLRPLGTSPPNDILDRTLERVSMGLTVNRQKMVFFKVNRQKCRVRLNVKKFQELKNLTISADLHGILAREESLN